MKKRVLALILTISIAMGFFIGCTGKPAPTPTPTPSISTSPSATPSVEPPATEPPTRGSPLTSQEPAEPTSKQIKLDDVWKKIQESGLELPGLSNLPDEMLKETYGISKDDIKQSIVMMPMMNVQATEIALFEAKDEASLKNVIAGIEKRQTNKYEEWKRYLPDQFEIVQNYKMKVFGNYVCYVVAGNPDKLIDIYKGFFK